MLTYFSEAKKDIYKELEPMLKAEKEYYSAGLAPVQVAFFARAQTKLY